MPQEVSSQKRGEAAPDSGRMPSKTMAPPQERAVLGLAGWDGIPDLFGDRFRQVEQSRQSASLSARWPLARKP